MVKVRVRCIKEWKIIGLLLVLVNLHSNGCNVPLNVVLWYKTILKESVFSDTSEPTIRAKPCMLVFVRGQ